MTLEEAVKAGPDLKLFEHEGVVYSNRSAYVISQGRDPQTIAVRMCNGYTFEQAMSLLSEDISCATCEKQFKPKSTANKYCSPACKQQAAVQRNSLGATGNGFRVETVIRSVIFSSQAQVCSKFQVDRLAYRRRVAKGMTPEEAILSINPRAIHILDSL